MSDDDGLRDSKSPREGFSREREPVSRGTASSTVPPRVEHGSSEDNLGRISAELLSQVTDINGIREELDTVNKSFESFKQDYSHLLTLYNETNDQLQELLKARAVDDTATRVAGATGTDSRCEDLEERLRIAEIEREKYKEMYADRVQDATTAISPVAAAVAAQNSAMQHRKDVSELEEQIRDMAERMQHLQLDREEFRIRLQQNIAEKEHAIDEAALIKEQCEQLEKDISEIQLEASLCQEQLTVKNTIIDKLRTEFTELGEENTRLRAEVSRFEEKNENRERLLDSAHFNQDDLVKDYQALQYRCSETEKREQDALLYIKDCLKLVEQTQYEKEQLVIQAAQMENMRNEMEASIESLLAEASSRTKIEVDKIRADSNLRISQLINECGQYQEKAADLESQLEEIERQKEFSKLTSNKTEVEIQLADKDALIFKLKEHLNTLQQDNLSLTDQLMEVSNTLNQTKEHYDVKISTLNLHLTTEQERHSRLVKDNAEVNQSKLDLEKEVSRMKESEKSLRGRINDLTSKLNVSEEEMRHQVAEVREEEANKRDMIRRSHDQHVNHLRQELTDKQNEVLRLQDLVTNSQLSQTSKEMDIQNRLVQQTKKARDATQQQRIALDEAEKARTELAKECEERFQTESRLQAVNMQLNSANRQIEIATENEAKLVAEQKRLQLKIDKMEFERDRNIPFSKTIAATPDSDLAKLIIPLTNSVKQSKTKSRRRERRDKKEKHEITKLFGNQLKKKHDKKREICTSTPHTDKSDVTLKFTDHGTTADHVTSDGHVTSDAHVDKLNLDNSM